MGRRERWWPTEGMDKRDDLLKEEVSLFDDSG